MPLDLDEYRRWPLWQAPADAAAPITDGYGHIACFVAPENLRGLRGQSAGIGTEVRMGVGGLSRALAARTIAERLYQQLVGYEIRYDVAPWEPKVGQRLRHPAWTLSPSESATCVDFAILFAAMCLREQLAPFLVMLRGERDGVPVGHAMVGVDLDRSPEALAITQPLAACENKGSSGVSRVLYPESLIEDPAVLLVDPTLASRDHKRSFKEAVLEAGKTLTSGIYRHAHLVDVAQRQAFGDTPLPVPEHRAALRRRLPEPRHVLESFPSRAGVQRRLTPPPSKVVILGESGVGKSELARDTAAGVDNGVGWFLIATNENTLITSLAEAELAERGERQGVSDDRDLRQELARAALSRLGRADTPWAVVVDNADCPPSTLRRWLPKANSDFSQVLIVTTTKDEWQEEGHEVVRIEALQPDEVQVQLGDGRLVRLADGRPLLIQAFRVAAVYLKVSLDLLAERLEAAADGLQDSADRLVGPWALWEVLSDKLTKPAADMAKSLAWLLPDRTPVGVLNQAHPSAQADVDELVSSGLVSRSTEGGEHVVSMHRLFGQVIRQRQRTQRQDRRIVTELLNVRDVRELLLLGADPEITTELERSLVDLTFPLDAVRRDHRRGKALWALGTIQEMYQGVKTSAKTFEHATSYLDEKKGEDRPLIADCLHGRAREINQNSAFCPKAITQARAWMAKAIELRDVDDIVGRSKHRALDGLLLQRYACNTLPSVSDQIAKLREAMEILDESYNEREKVQGVDRRLLDRASFNRCGVRVDLAQRVASEAVKHLRDAELIYRETLDFRSTTYPDPSPLIAASHNGLATCLYYLALFDRGADQDALLAQGTEHAIEALRQRRILRGDQDDGDVLKSASILAKLALARVWKIDYRDFAKVYADVGRELPRPSPSNVVATD